MSIPDDAPRWEGYEHEDIVALLAGMPAGAASQYAEGRWHATWFTIEYIEAKLSQAITGSGSGWEGAAASAMTAGATPLGTWALAAAVQALSISKTLTAQAGYADFTRDSMPPIRTPGLSAEPPSSIGVTRRMIEDWQRADQARDDDTLEARRLMSVYTDNSYHSLPGVTGSEAPPTVVLDASASAGGRGGAGHGGLGALAAVPVGAGAAPGGASSPAGAVEPLVPGGVYAGIGTPGASSGTGAGGTTAGLGGAGTPVRDASTGVPGGGVPPVSTGTALPPNGPRSSRLAPPDPTLRAPGAGTGTSRTGSAGSTRTGSDGIGGSASARGGFGTGGDARTGYDGALGGGPTGGSRQGHGGGTAARRSGYGGGTEALPAPPRADRGSPERPFPANPPPAGEPTSRTGRAATSGNPGFMPMGAGAGAGGGSEHRRPGYLVEDADVFTDKRWVTPHIINAPESEDDHG